MVNYQYSYLVGDLLLLVVWLILYLWRKDNRREMVWISVTFGIIGLLVEPIMATDWWHPETITNTIPGIESFLYGFVTAGIAAVIYEDVFEKKIRLKKKREGVGKKFLLAGIATIVFSFCLFILKFSSFYSATIMSLLLLVIILFKRKDLVKNAFFSGFLLVIVSIPVYLAVEYLFPGVIAKTWKFENLWGTNLFGIPLEDIVWIMVTGFFIGPLYEYLQEGKLINVKR